MPESAEKLINELTAVGLLSSDQATKYDVEIKTGIESLLERLVSEEVITAYQAQKFREGKVSDIVFGDYLVVDKIGQGGMGTVLLAEHRRMQRQVAIKVLPVTSLDSEAAVARFYQEVKVAAQLTHPNIVHAYDASEHHGFHYLVMEFVPGHDLARVLEMLGPIPPGLAVDYIIQAALGLEYAHRKGIVHRDIKPSNLLLDDEGRIKVLDMGLARIGGQGIGGDASMHLTTTGQVMGTVDYMSPEQAEDTRQADKRSDIYSLGCTLHRLLTGIGPFSRETVVKTILAHRDAEIPSLTSITPELDRVFRKMVAKNPDERYQATGPLIEDLRRLVQNLPEGYSPPPRSTPAGIDAATIQPGSSSVSKSQPTIDRPSTEPNSPGETKPETLNVSYMNYVPPQSTESQPSVNPYLNPSGIPKGFVAPPAHGRLMKHHRAKKLLTVSIIGFALAFCIVGVIPSIVVWVMANSDLAEMQQSQRDPAGADITKASRIVAQIGVGIAALGFLMTVVF